MMKNVQYRPPRAAAGLTAALYPNYQDPFQPPAKKALSLKARRRIKKNVFPEVYGF